jgi:hypothetical protein
MSKAAHVLGGCDLMLDSNPECLELSVSLVDVPELCPKDPKKVSPCISHPREEFLCIKQKQTQALA